MTTSEVEVDVVLTALGPMGTFAVVQCFLFYLGYLADAHHLFSYVFTGQEVGHRCASPANQNETDVPELDTDWCNSTVVQYGQCAISVSHNVNGNIISTEYPCLYGMEYDAPSDTSIVSEFELVCERTALAGLTQTLLALGAGLGSIFWPWLSDILGRKRIIVVSLTLLVATTLVAAFAPNYSVFSVTKFFVGFLETGIGLTAVTAGVELFPTSRRALVSGFVSTLWWAVCIASLAPIAYLLRDHSWRTLQIALCASPCLVIFMIIFLREPVQWLVANGRMEEAERVLKMAARWNRKDPQTILRLFRGRDPSETGSAPASDSVVRHAPCTPRANGEEETAAFVGEEEMRDMAWKEEREQSERVDEKLGFMDLLRHPLLRRNALVSWFIWFVDSLAYNALYLMSGTLALSLHASFLLNAAVEGASCLLMVIMLSRFGRKQTIGAFHVIAGVGLIASGICFNYQANSSLQIVGTIASLCGKMGIGGAFNVMFLYTPEIFPTNIRNRALGTSVSVSTLGGMIAPYSNVLLNYAVWAPGVLIGTLSLVAILFLLALPESRDKELPQNIRDLEASYDVTSSGKTKRGSAQEKSVIVSGLAV